MTISADILRMHLNYNSWASGRLMEAVRDFPDNELRHDFGTADRTLIGTLVHIFGADRIWLSRVQGRSRVGSRSGIPRLGGARTGMEKHTRRLGIVGEWNVGR